MRRLLALGLLLVVPAAVRADAISPGFHRVPLDVVLECESDTTGYAFFLATYGRPVERLTVTPGQPVRIDGTGRVGTGSYVSLYAVPHSALASFGEATPPFEWFQPSSGNKFLCAHFDFVREVILFDPRRRIVETYRVDLGTHKLNLVLTSVNGVSPWVRSAWVVPGVLLAAGVAWLGVWAIRRNRPNSSDPPPRPAA